MSRTPTLQKPLGLEDVTKKYLETATPNSHTVQDLHTYVVQGAAYTVDGDYVVLDYTPHEKEVAELLERELGGEIFMVPRVNSPEGVSTPDYLFRGQAYDLKTLGPKAGKNAIYNRVKKARRQAKNFVVDITRALLNEAFVDEQLQKIYRMNETAFVDEVIVIDGGTIIKIVKRT